MKNKALIFALILAVMPVASLAAQGNIENGKTIYQKRCWWCHGEEGAGDGPAADFLNPRPRDLTEGVYKFKTTPFDEFTPSDEDFFNMIKGARTQNHISGWTGMNDSSMPGWGDMLTDQEIWDLVPHIKSFSGLEKNEKPSVAYDKQIKSSDDSIAKGKEKFDEMCSECHGKQGRGDGTKKLKDDWGYRTWPRNFTKGWSFRVSNDPKDIYTRITNGIPGTQMPSFADPASKKQLSEEERWNIANYVASLEEPLRKPSDNTVIKALKVDGALPEAVDDPAWQNAEFTSFFMVPQIIGKERFFTPSLNAISAKALFNENEIALLLAWDDRTESVPGDKKSEEVADGAHFPDAVAVQLPTAMLEAEKPYFAMGDAAKPVNIMYWRSKDSPEGSPVVKLYNAAGFGPDKREDRDPASIGFAAKGAYDNGTWRVIMKRPLKTGDPSKDLQITEGAFIPIAFAAWDGSNQEKGSKHELTTWYWLFLTPPTGAGVFLWPLAVAFLVFGAEILWLRSSRKK